MELKDMCRDLRDLLGGGIAETTCRNDRHKPNRDIFHRERLYTQARKGTRYRKTI